MNSHTSSVRRTEASSQVKGVARLLDLTNFSLTALARCNDREFERAAADVLRHIDRLDSSVAGHNS